MSIVQCWKRALKKLHLFSNIFATLESQQNVIPNRHYVLQVTLLKVEKNAFITFRKLFIVFRFIYVRNAHDLLRDKARLLHIVVWLFISIWFSKRAITYSLSQLVRGLNYTKTTKGMLCMVKNLGNQLIIGNP